jgi:hypothetical protein
MATGHAARNGRPRSRWCSSSIRRCSWAGQRPSGRLFSIPAPVPRDRFGATLAALDSPPRLTRGRRFGTKGRHDEVSQPREKQLGSLRQGTTPAGSGVWSANGGAIRRADLEMQRVLPARPRAVFVAFTERNQLVRWWGPTGFIVPSLEFEARVGATYRIEMQPPEAGFVLPHRPLPRNGCAHSARLHVCLGATRSRRCETLVCLVFRRLRESTEVTHKQGPFKTEARRTLHRDGSDRQLSQAPTATRESGVASLKRRVIEGRSTASRRPHRWDHGAFARRK